jgi:hypothetical protein
MYSESVTINNAKLDQGLFALPANAKRLKLD